MIPAAEFFPALPASSLTSVAAAAIGDAMQLDHLGLIAVTGADAATFLQNQLTNDVQNLQPGEARLAGLCSTKGRLLATFLCWRSEDGFYLQCERELLPDTLRHLNRFVLRAKARLEDVSERFDLFGLAGERAESFLKTRFQAVPETIWAMSHGSAGSLIQVPDSMGQRRWQWIAPSESGAGQTISDAELVRANASIWRWLEIRAGLPHIGAATRDRFVPQMINFEALGGVSFKKGCYPGQEVVARSQYLGKLKRRMTVAHSAAEPSAVEALLAGSDVVALDNGGAGEPLGTLVNAEPSPLGGVDFLVELPIAAIGPGGPRLGLAPTDTGSAIPVEVIGLPYSLPDQEIFVRPKL